MADLFSYRCRSCGARTPWDSHAFVCACGGLFEWDAPPRRFDVTAIDHAEPSLLRYREFLPPFLDEHLAAVSLGEGWTKLIRLSREDPDVLLKLDHLMPTMSFKDRGAVVLVAVARGSPAPSMCPRRRRPRSCN